MTRTTVVAVVAVMALASVAQAEQWWTFNRWWQDSQEAPAPDATPMIPTPAKDEPSPALDSDMGMYGHGSCGCSGWWANYCAQRRAHCHFGGKGVCYSDAGCEKVVSGCHVCHRCRRCFSLALRHVHVGSATCGCAGTKELVEPKCCGRVPHLLHRGRVTRLGWGTCGCGMGEYSSPIPQGAVPEMAPPQPEPSPEDGPTT